MEEVISVTQTAPAADQPKKSRLKIKIIAATAIVCAAAGLSVFLVHRKRVQDGYYIRQQVAAESARYQVNNAMLACFWQLERDEAIASFQTQPETETMPHFDMSRSLKEQPYSGNVSWYDHLLEETETSITETLKYCEAAALDGYVLPDADKDACRKQAAETDLSEYQTGVNADDLAEVLILKKTADAYKERYMNTIRFPDEELQQYLQAHRADYLTLKLLSYRFSYANAGDALSTVRSAAYSAATALAECHSQKAFTENVTAYLTASGASEDKIRLVTESLVTVDTANSFLQDIQNWVIRDGAQFGDTIIAENPTEQYFEVCQMLDNPKLDESKTVDLRVIRLSAEKYGSTENALAAADDLRKRCGIDGSVSDSFAALAMAHSEDIETKADGGLIVGFPQSRTVYGETVSKWAFAAQRKQGDMLITEIPDGVLLMYFDGRNDRNAWQNAIWLKLAAEKKQAFYEQVNSPNVTLHEEQFVIPQ